MLKNTLIAGAGIVAGMFFAYFLITKPLLINNLAPENLIPKSNKSQAGESTKKQVVGFLPFWLIDKAETDYLGLITQLSYFSVVIETDGSIQRFTAPGESDPGWRALSTGKVDSFLSSQSQKGIELSLTVFSADDKKIDAFLENPIKSADNLVNDLAPILQQYGFGDLNIDVEKVADATPDQRRRFTDFVRQIRKNLDPSITISLDVVATSFVKETNLCNPKELAEIVDYIVLMGYDFHNPGSFVTGPVAPQAGAGIVNEFDIVSAVQAAKTQMDASKLILAVPLYGYSWETINGYPRAAVMPGSAYSISSKSVAEMLSRCPECKVKYDETDSEAYIITKNTETGLFEQTFYPDIRSTQIKIDFAENQNLGGIALWALGYEDNEILTPLRDYLRVKN